MKEICKREKKVIKSHQTFFPLNYSLPFLLFLQLSFSSDHDSFHFTHRWT